MSIASNIDKNHQIHISNENDLHKRVVAWIRRFRAELIVVPGLGELQKTDEMRMEAWGKGYKKGTPDLLILNRHEHYRGMAIELKTPTGGGNLSKHQKLFLKQLRKNGFFVLVSNDYDEVIWQVERYALGTREDDSDTDVSDEEEEAEGD